MASSFVEYKDNGFWAKDGFVEAFQILLFEEIQNRYGDSIHWLNEYKKVLAIESLPLIYGGMSMRLDETLINNERRAILLKLLEEIRKKISSDKNYLTGKHLNVLRREIRYYLIEMKEITPTEKELEKNLKEGGYGNDLSIENYYRGFDMLSNLINGDLYYKVDTPITYWGD